jgi:hypothetical protein
MKTDNLTIEKRITSLDITLFDGVVPAVLAGTALALP